jgi:hypothetical protein
MRVIEQYLAKTPEPLDAGSAWRHVYRLLAWIDPTTGLVHVYESDKTQPGRTWHARALRATTYIAEQLGVPRTGLREAIDVLFKASIGELARRDGLRVAEASVPYASTEAEEDPSGVVALIEKHLEGAEAHSRAQAIATEVRRHIAVENKRKNIIGEGFEDVVGVLLQRVARLPPERLHFRARLSDLPGFRAPSSRRKEKRPDVAVVTPGQRTDYLISTKWSVRADREDQFADEYQFYADQLAQKSAPEKILITNEFDRARLVSAVESPRFRFDRVVHIEPALLQAAYGEGEIAELSRILRQRKLISLREFLEEMNDRFARA